VEQDREWRLLYENSTDHIEVQHIIRARELWTELIAGAWDFAEPGCLFWDTVQRFSTSDRYPGMRVVRYGVWVSGMFSTVSSALPPFYDYPFLPTLWCGSCALAG
jgi:hypothetical protein